jgi:hypothetical protein
MKNSLFFSQIAKDGLAIPYFGKDSSGDIVILRGKSVRNSSVAYGGRI